MQADFVKVDGTSLLVRQWIEADGRPVLYWHGGGGASDELPQFAPALTEAGYRVYVPDAPGYGRSPALDADGYARRHSRISLPVWSMRSGLRRSCGSVCRGER